ncbi:uncharacterized protein TM35_000161440 [Trypanosoma theileri]|uniref:Uncharacterized protein n=1 Tax=Trypanosoma theileri TaxID=67003 RepID=A0A1X0NUX9_9TRYP|nr:uncharacterized protein TM35_000161440 [Trypanosoma theileri]ORC88506.1 hypothetical protein TM35_000161440 [Trypanosoma theileri]
MANSHTPDAVAQQLQEERLARLCDDNAFVNVAEVLRRQRRDGAPAGNAETEAEFLEPSALPGAGPARLHLSRALLEQHRAYLKALEGGRDGGVDATTASSTASAESSSGEEESTSGRGRRPHGGEHRRGEGKKRMRKETEQTDVRVSKVMDSSLAVSRQMEQEYQSVRTWSQQRRVPPLELASPMPSYISMAAPPPTHTGGYHLCSVCLLPAGYKCLRCRRALFCSIECHVMHEATRCLKFIV